MKRLKGSYVFLVLIHVFIGLTINSISGVSKILFLLTVAYFTIGIIKAPSHKKVFHVLLGCAYVVGSETLFRMTGGNVLYEASKYLVILFVIMGILFKGVSGKSYPYFLYLLMLVPSVIVASTVLGYDLKFRSSIAFALSGPLCLGMAALFIYDKKVTSKEMHEILLYLGLPIISMTTYLYLYTPSVREIVTGTGSNFAASGGFGPNQVATVLGLGMFVFTVRFFLNSPNLFYKLLNAVVILAISFRAIVTFSRGGVITAIMMILIFLGILYLRSNSYQKQRVVATVVLLGLVAIATWSWSSRETGGLIDKRYANQDAAGKVKDDFSTGRVDLFVGELEGFVKHPFLGVGASGMKQFRLEHEGDIIASHNEISRMLSEHGMLGVIMLLILMFKPIGYWLSRGSNIFFLAFLCFWFATINHSAMRIAAPGFIYALTLINIVNEKRPLHRKSIAAQAR